MPVPPPPSIRRRRLSPSFSGLDAPPSARRRLSPSFSGLDAPPSARRRLFSTPLQPPLAYVPPPPRRALSFKINNTMTSDAGNLIGMFFCFNTSPVYVLTSLWQGYLTSSCLIFWTIKDSGFDFHKWSRMKIHDCWGSPKIVYST